MSDCEQIQEALSAFIDGELSEERRQQIQAHIESCEACKGTVAGWRKIDEAARTVPAPGDDAWEKSWTGIERKMTNRRATLRLSHEIRRGVVVAAVAASVLVAAFLLVPASPPLGVSGTAKAAEFEVISIETGPSYIPMIVMPQGKDLPVIWVERMEQAGSGDDRS